MIYQIPDFKLEKLEKQCNRIRNKGVTVIFDVLEPCEVIANNNEKVKVPGHKVSVEGQYIINGWEFVATIEHTSNGNIVRCINDMFEGEIPEKYKTTGPECEHCHKRIGRKDTYLVYNRENKEFKQVGKTCLQSYTGGLNAETCALTAQFFNVLEDAGYFEDDFEYGWNSPKYIDAKSFKKYAYPLIKKSGYKKEGTVEETLDAMFGRGDYYNSNKTAEVASDEEIKSIDEYEESVQDDNYGYFRNAKIAWKQDALEYRDLPLVASFIGTYFKHLNQVAQAKRNSETTQWVGNIGDKIEIEIASYRVLWENHYEVAWHTYVNTYTYEIIDNNGNTYIWKSSNPIDMMEVNETMEHIKPLKLKGTIKGHDQYQGKKQTVLTRCKITEYELLRKQENVSSNRDAFKALDELIDELQG